MECGTEKLYIFAVLNSVFFSNYIDSLQISTA